MKSTRSWPVVLMAVTLGLPWVSARRANAQGPSSGPDLAGAAAMDALQKSLATVRATKDFQLMGLTSRSEMEQVTLGRPMQVREIGYDNLLSYREGSDVASVFTGPDQLLYPVVVRGEVRSSLTLVRNGQEWRLTTYGDVGRTREIEKTRLGVVQRAGESGRGEAAVSLASVPAFGLYLVALARDGRTLLSPVSASVPAGLELNDSMEESEAIARLSAYAKDFDKKYGDGIRKKQLVK